MLFGHAGKNVITLMSSIILKPIPVTPEIRVLGLIPGAISISSHQIKMIDICLVLARRSIAFYWKKIEGPSIGHFLKDFLHCIVLELKKITIKYDNTIMLCLTRSHSTSSTTSSCGLWIPQNKEMRLLWERRRDRSVWIMLIWWNIYPEMSRIRLSIKCIPVYLKICKSIWTSLPDFTEFIRLCRNSIILST